jgi:hypothetical protein
LSALVLASRLALYQRRDLAALVGVHLIRAAWARADNMSSPSDETLSVADVGRGLLTYHAGVLFDEVSSPSIDVTRMIDMHADMGTYVTYPIRCLRLLELFGLMGLAEEGVERRAEVSAFCQRFVRQQPGASHPISDHWAACIPPVALLIWERDPELAGQWLQEICVWVCDHYEQDSSGLANYWSTPEEEITRALGSTLQHLDLPRRPDSFIASVLLDLSAALELSAVYDALINDILAVRIHPSVVECEDGAGLYQDVASGVFLEPWVQYDGHYRDYDGWQCSGPHRRAIRFSIQKHGRAWDLLAICSALRDRCLPLLLREIAHLENFS